jgi:hypothetical protein
MFSQGSLCCGYGTDGKKTNGYDCVMIPGASTMTMGGMKPAQVAIQSLNFRDPIFRLRNLQLQCQRCSRLERLLQSRIK